MKSKLIKIIAIAIISFSSLAILSPSPVFAANNNDKSNVCDLKDEVSDSVYESAGCNGGSDEFSSVVADILKAVIDICGLVAVVFIVIGGIQYMTSSGDAGKLKQAKNTIVYALIGLIICALAFAIVNWVIAKVLKQ